MVSRRIILLVIGLLAMACVCTSCFSSRKIHTSGLKGIKLGDDMIPRGVDAFRGHAVKDTVYDEDGFVWRAAILEYTGGRVWVEEDFFGASRINRIRIETPELSYRKHFKVGSTVEDLLALGFDWEILHLPEYNRIDLYTKGVHFLIHDKDISPEVFNSKDLSIRKIPKSKKVVAIVVM